MISTQKNFLFVHIPKTGGNSIQTILAPFSEDEIVASGTQDGVERFGVHNKRYELRKHATLSRYREALGARKFARFFKFTCVRNPWERLISHYFTPGKQRDEWDRETFRQM